MMKFIVIGVAGLFGFIALVALIAYIPRLVAWFGGLKPQKRYYSEKNNKIAIIVPARNESVPIKALLESFARQTYNKEHFDFYVVVKEANDPTMAMVRKAGGYPLVFAEQRNKGDALDYCLKTILADDKVHYDAYLIVDADCVMADNYMEEMNNALASGRQIVLSKKLVKNYLINDKRANTMASASNGLIWTIIDELGNRYKSDHDITIMTIGTGLMLRSDIIEKQGGWIYRQTLTEDIELMYDCVINDYSTFYYSYAVLYVEESPSLIVTNKRRNRWLNGVVNSKILYAKRLEDLPKNKKNFWNVYFTSALELMYLFIGALTIQNCIQIVLSASLLFLGNKYWFLALIFFFIGMAVIYLSFLILTIACMIIERKTIKLPWYKKVALLFYHPVFYMWYTPIILEAYLTSNGRRGWETIARMKLQEEQAENQEEEVLARK